MRFAFYIILAVLLFSGRHLPIPYLHTMPDAVDKPHLGIGIGFGSFLGVDFAIVIHYSKEFGMAYTLFMDWHLIPLPHCGLTG